MQKRARQDVISALEDEEPNLTNLRKTGFVQACIRESLRINTPISLCSGSSPVPGAQLRAMYELRKLAVMLLKNYEWTLTKNSPHANFTKNGFSPFALGLPGDISFT
ncbi:hypothetical protein CVT24_012763 [Panaeolus cyanescens]|uniref:Uncharacterized protein n=1 Tax=Panaeolus cyanescens TaxID=181874 RepID=A0A409YJH3_9AGAR|nr:hypothetical protein CVT24_012763 [Panaeolus cyanescens]